MDSASYNKMYKLSEEKAILIREAADQYDFSIRGNSMKFDTLWADRFGTRPCTIRNVRKGRHWNGSISQ